MHIPFWDQLINDCIWEWLEATITHPSVLYHPVTWLGWSMCPAERRNKLVSGTACFKYTTSTCRNCAPAVMQWHPDWLIVLFSFTTRCFTVWLMASMTGWSVIVNSFQNYNPTQVFLNRAYATISSSTSTFKEGKFRHKECAHGTVWRWKPSGTGTEDSNVALENVRS